jgi:MarR family transcriptional regulator, transcriptional regulator for hemolysin
MMNRETTGCAPADREALVRRATEVLEAAAEGIRRDLDHHAAAYGLSDAKLEVIEVLARREERACLCDLGDHLKVTRPNITKLVDGLQRVGLVERRPHPGDGRRVQAHLTPAGEALAATALAGREERMAQRWEGLDDEALLSVIDLLVRAADAPAPAAASSS